MDTSLLTSNRLAVLDWDDTLFPTSAVLKDIDLNAAMNDPDYQLSKSTKVKFSYISARIQHLLSSIKKTSDILILTNATERWINVCLKHLELRSFFDENHIAVLSARIFQEPSSSPWQWKDESFSMFLSYLPDHPWTQLVSVGDSAVDEQFVQYQTKKQWFENVLFVRLMEQPSYQQLFVEMDYLYSALPSFEFLPHDPNPKISVCLKQ